LRGDGSNVQQAGDVLHGKTITVFRFERSRVTRRQGIQRLNDGLPLVMGRHFLGGLALFGNTQLWEV
jgi:hypothetical protein